MAILNTQGLTAPRSAVITRGKTRKDEEIPLKALTCSDAEKKAKFVRSASFQPCFEKKYLFCSHAGYMHHGPISEQKKYQNPERKKKKTRDYETQQHHSASCLQPPQFRPDTRPKYGVDSLSYHRITSHSFTIPLFPKPLPM